MTIVNNKLADFYEALPTCNKRPGVVTGLEIAEASAWASTLVLAIPLSVIENLFFAAVNVIGKNCSNKCRVEDARYCLETLTARVAWNVQVICTLPCAFALLYMCRSAQSKESQEHSAKLPVSFRSRSVEELKQPWVYTDEEVCKKMIASSPQFKGNVKKLDLGVVTGFLAVKV